MSTTSELARLLNLEYLGPDVEITSVALGTQHVQPGSLFIAVQGAKSHGLDHLDMAIAQGAVALLTDRPGDYPIPTLIVPEPRAAAGEIANLVYGTSASGQKLYGVTGTNGKTSTVFYLNQLLNAMDEPAGLVSSALVLVGGEQVPVELTTPEAPRVHQLLSEMRKAGEQSAAVEVSAQGLSRHRVTGLQFKVAGFTNLSRDHLDDYPDMASYLAAKAELFTDSYSDLAVVMLEDEYSKKLFAEITIPKVGIGLDYHYEQTSTELRIFGKRNLSLPIELPILMAKNLTLATVMLLEAGYLPEQLEEAASHIELSVPGRLQRVSDRTPHVFVDYAHTPAAVAAAAKELKGAYPSLTIMLAASGDRDRGKRAQMAQAASEYADRILVTDQHPRSEDPAKIRAELLAVLSQFEMVEEIADPAACIRRAVELTDTGGAILWCGPGHLKYREVMGQKLPFDAVAEARKVLGHD